jgi:pimeloyl-ACP methyl ester carboxylesterase
MSELTPFVIDVPQDEVDDLRLRVERARWPDELPGVGWDYGVARDHLGELVRQWRDDFDWRERERVLNQWPQFLTQIDGQRVHVAQVRSSRADAVPLLLVHGWPSTLADFLPVVHLLTEPSGPGPAFDVVIPSLPGFGFSGPTTEPGWDVTRIAKAFAELMRRLGYDRYVVQGGDFGSLIAPEVARVDAAHVQGVHVNALVTLGSIDWTNADPLAGLTDEEKVTVYGAAASWKERSGYAAIQSTRPQTLAYALNDSPVGLLAWDLEWFVDYDPLATAQTPVDPRAVLTDVTICWLTGTAGSSARLYKEAAYAFAEQPSSGVATAVAVFPGDAAIRTLAERSNRVVRWTTYDRGGHFASLQAPDLLVADIRAFVEQLSEVSGVVDQTT